MATKQSVGSLPAAAGEDWCEENGLQQGGGGQAKSQQYTGSFLLERTENDQQFRGSYGACAARRKEDCGNRCVFQRSALNPAVRFAGIQT